MGAAGSGEGVGTLEVYRLDDNNGTTYLDSISGVNTLTISGASNPTNESTGVSTYSFSLGATGVTSLWSSASNFEGGVDTRTVEIWAKGNNAASTQYFMTVVGLRTTAAAAANPYASIFTNDDGRVYFSGQTGVATSTGSYAVTSAFGWADAFVHYSIMTDGTQGWIHVDGTLAMELTFSTAHTCTPGFGKRMQDGGAPGSQLMLYNNFRVSSGLVYDTAGFTPPTPPAL